MQHFFATHKWLFSRCFHASGELWLYPSKPLNSSARGWT